MSGICEASLDERARLAASAEGLNRPPILEGYTCDPVEAFKARDEGRLLAVRLETNRSCNLRCKYCYAESGEAADDELSYERLLNVVRQAAEMGARSVVVIGGGEPTIYEHFKDLVDFIDMSGMVPVVFTNLVTMTDSLSDFLYSKNASVMGKLDSTRPEVQDFLIGKQGAGELLRRGLDNLIGAGFTEVDDAHHLRLGVSCVTNRLNMYEIDAIWSYCRENNIFPNMEVLTPTGRAKKLLDGCFIDAGEIRGYKLRLLAIDGEKYGFEWLPYTPLPGSGCLQYLFSMYVTIEGNVRPCAPTKFEEDTDLHVDGEYPYNVRKMSLKRIYDSPLFEYARNIDSHLEGRCAGCEFATECIGCRGYAYAVGMREGKGTFEALRGECAQCFK